MFKRKKKDPEFFIKPPQAELLISAQPNRSNRLKLFFSSRFSIIFISVLLIFAVMLGSTASLQLQAAQISQESNKTAVSRQYEEVADRGDIYDSEGRLLATTVKKNMLYYADADLSDDELNAVLLKLAELLDYYEIDYGHAIDDYLDLSTMKFVLSQDAMIYWQENKNYLGLKALPDGKTESATDTLYVKESPQVFYDYLCQTKFGISDQYNELERKKILRLRFEIYLNNWMFEQGTPVELAEDLPDNLVTILNEQNYIYQGVVTTEESVRQYTADAQFVAPVLGYVGQITSDEYATLESQGYSINDMVGKAGIEAVAERYLHGTNGLSNYNIWTSAEDQGDFYTETENQAAVAGGSVRLTIDMDIQKAGTYKMAQMIDTLNNDDEFTDFPKSTGSAVMLDLKNNGAVLAMINLPTYDPQAFMDMDTDEEAQAQVENYLSDDDGLPMINRAIQTSKAPGSTFKVFAALAILSNGVADASSTVNCTGTYLVDGMTFDCLGKHGITQLDKAIAYSCNTYFYTYGSALGIDRLWPTLKDLGLGEKTGIELYGETAGYRPSRDLKASLYKDPSNQLWYTADTVQTSIGQGLNSYTAVQLARAVGAIATGYLTDVHVIDEITGSDGSVLQKAQGEPTAIDYDEADLEPIRAGMLRMTTDPESTVYSTFVDAAYQSGGKTGTADTVLDGYGMTNDGIYICYAPYDDPQVAIAAWIETGARGAYISELAKVMFDTYFGDTDYSDFGITQLPGVSAEAYSPTETD
ncbi:MAG: penicillin-binding transpeptidase domain-containing protein [Oscillospiraceae bacterium]|nr:penicillin-binding transpeptidase domain-containing protein [Oscillospiraceae bacterium]MDD4368582.1 penicillin-binding transpeptidase domain-containing protein [Oscillospiraceae bacterium]